jgi:hypothetical protein
MKEESNKGTVPGVDGPPVQSDSVLPNNITAAEINEQNRKFWYQQQLTPPQD